MRRLISIILSFIAISLYAQSSKIVSLDGTWDFRCTSGNNSGKWGKIQVPCNWELQGYGDYTYGRWYTIKGEKPSSEEGEYKTNFKIEKSVKTKGGRVIIWFDGVMTDTEVRVNGQLVGQKHQGGFYRFSYDITEYVKVGNNRLDVHVWKESQNKSVNAAERKADWWLFGGIFRPVWLEIKPQENIQHFAVDSRQNGHVLADLQLEGNVSGYQIDARVKKVGEEKTVTYTNVSKVGRSNNLTVEFDAKNIDAWDTEHPNLYELTFVLKDYNGKTVHEKSSRIGFRTIEFREQDGFYLNGTKIVAKGVNRHTFWPTTGRTTTKEQSIADAKLIKEMNMNAVRSHYPPDTHFLDACDSLGILYIDEIAGWQNAVDDTIGARILPEMIRRDVNHPCIYVWSNGNEGGFNYSLDDKFALYDPQTREVIHPWADWGKIDTHHYPAYLTGIGRFNNGSKVFMPTETMHAMYDQGGGAALDDFYRRWKESPLFAGCYIWAFCDEAVVRTDKHGALDSDGSNAPDGILGPYREKEGSYYSIREIWSPIKISPFRITESFDGTIFVSNDYLFTNLKGAKLICNGKECILPDIEPGETRKVKIPTSTLRQNDFLTIEAVGPQGDTVCTTSYPVITPKDYYKRAFAQKQLNPSITANAEKIGGAYVLTNGNFQITFDASTGLIKTIIDKDKEIPFNNGPIGVGMEAQYLPEKSYCRVEKDSEGNNSATFVAKYKGAIDSITWNLMNNGLLSMDAVLLNHADGGSGFDGKVKDDKVGNYGLTFSYPEEECKGMTWVGRGPYRVWKNRIQGTNFGLWHKDYNNTVTGEPRSDGKPQEYPEFKGYHANLYWASIESDKYPFQVYSETENLYLRIFTPQEPKIKANNQNTMKDFPDGDISFLLDIQAIQSFKPTEHQGPSSQPGNIRLNKGDEGLHIRLLFEF